MEYGIFLSRVEVTCNDEALRDEGPEAYTLEVTADAAGTAKVSIRASAEHGALPQPLAPAQLTG